MTRYIKRHSLQARLTHGITISCCILLAISGLFVFIPQLTAMLPAEVVWGIRMAHRTIGLIFVIVPIVSAILAPKGVKHLLSIYFAKWDKDDVTFMKKFIPYMLAPKKVHMPDQHEVKSGQRIADGILFISGFFIGISGIFLILGTTVVDFGATFMLIAHLVHDVCFLLLVIFGLAHIYLGAGIFQPYRGTIRLMFGNGNVSESDALYHWGYWAREEIDEGKDIVYVDEEPPATSAAKSE